VCSWLNRTNADTRRLVILMFRIMIMIYRCRFGTGAMTLSNTQKLNVKNLEFHLSFSKRIKLRIHISNLQKSQFHIVTTFF